MPMSFSDPALGWATFVAVKLAGYTFVAHRMKREFPTPALPSPVLGAIRTVMGAGFGIAYGTLVGLTERALGSLSVVLFLGGLIPVRILEWHLLIRWCFDRRRAFPTLTQRWRVLGTLASFALDVPAILGLVRMGGVWLC